MSAPSLPTLDASRTAEVSGLRRWARWLIEPTVLIRIVLYTTTLIYLRTVLFDYVYDDTYVITLNPWMESWKHVPDFFTHSFWGFLEIPRVIDFYRPLVSLLLATILHVLGPAPGWFHLAAAGLHIAATYLVYRLACETVGDKTVAAIAAGWFGLHPTKVETAAWISGVSDSLSAVFLLASMIAYFQSKKDGEHKHTYLGFSATLLLLALFSKEAAVFAPILIGIYEFSVARSSFRQRLMASLRAVWLFLLVVGAAAAVRLLLVKNPAGYGLREIPMASTILTAPRALLWYVGRQVWPGELSIEYPVMLVRGFSFDQFVWPLCLLLVLSICLFFAVRKVPIGVFFASWFLLMIAPAILYQVTLQEHDRYAYLPSVASSIGAGYVLAGLRRFGAQAQAAVLIVLLAMISGFTWHYESYWDNDTKLFTHAVQVAPDNPKAQQYLANQFLSLGQPEKAEAVARKLIDRSKQSAEGWHMLGVVWLSQNKYEEAREALEKSIDLSPGETNIHWSMDLAGTDFRLGRYEQAAQIYRDQIRRHPNLSFLHRDLAQTLKAMGKSEEAAAELSLQRRLQ